MQYSKPEMRRSLFKLWVATTLIWAFLAANTFEKAYKKELLIANLVDPKIVYRVLEIDGTRSRYFLQSALEYIAETLMQVTPEDFVQVPHHCDEQYDSKTGGICWTDISKVRQILNDKDRNAEDLIKEQYSQFGQWRDASSLTKIGLFLKVGVLCIRGPIVVFLFGLFLMFTISNRQDQIKAS